MMNDPSNRHSPRKKPRPSVSPWRLAAMGCALALLLGCTDESPFAPGPGTQHRCLDSEIALSLTCDNPCPGSVVNAAIACAQTLEGILDESGKVCRFGDGSSVTFHRPLPDVSPPGTTEVSFTLRRQQNLCLRIHQAPLGGGEHVVSVDGDGLCFRQRESARSHDGSTSAAGIQTELICQQRRFMGDVSGCSSSPLLWVEVIGDGARSQDAGTPINHRWDIRLRAGDRITPLFSCRRP